MGQALSYLHESQWITEGSIWRPAPLTLHDEAGLPIGNAVMTSMLMTIYDLMDPLQPIVNQVDGTVSVLNARGCTLSVTGIFIITLSPPGFAGDTVILDSSRPYELRRVLVRYTWATGTKADALEITIVIRNLHKVP